jgi:hypothetical protein
MTAIYPLTEAAWPFAALASGNNVKVLMVGALGLWGDEPERRRCERPRTSQAGMLCERWA